MACRLMAAQHTLHVALTKPLVDYVGVQVTSGRYASASEVVHAGLRLLMERNQEHDGDYAKPVTKTDV